MVRYVSEFTLNKEYLSKNSLVDYLLELDFLEEWVNNNKFELI